MAPIIGAKFFPQNSSTLATIDALMVFAAGFLCRPLGGIFFGYFGDTRGRAKTLRTSIILITLSTLLVGLIPSYETAGLIAPLLFVILRLIQGLSIGGEYSGVMIYLAESAPENKRGFITSFAATGANLGFLLATLVFIVLNSLFTSEEINTWAWRLPFITVGLPGTLIIYFRFKLSETRVYSLLQQSHHLESQPFLSAIRFAPYQLLKILGLTCMSATFYYFFFGFMPTYLERYIGFDLKNTLIILSCLLIAMLFLVPLAGISGDYSSRKKMVVLANCAVILLVLPCFYLLQVNSILWTLIALSTATLISALDQGNTLTAIVENCPENVRYSGIAFSYNLGMALFGGTTPLIVTLLIEYANSIAPAYYLMLMASISLIAATTLVKNNQSLGPL
ncbi:MFS transporter [Legionella worsleiensis]|uniref:Major facilitator family transporter n=2 Tax=Legionella worsleiensis TaxID=45076 RepID=A0A0W1AHB7_9GAMM|nr:major facilitator family transporter [Legionella worsleiensis]STY32741.1 major facilitator family transporter [Legionella worsleiensis]